MGDTPLVSVITATYNWSSVLRYAIASVLRQECQDFELLVIGDGCTDDSADVVAAFDDPRIRWHNLPENSGNQSVPNQAGIAMARGRYIAYLGHDDLWFPSHLATLVGALEESGADIAYTRAALIGPEETGFHAISGLSKSGDYEYDTIFPPSAVMHRRDLTAEIGGWKDYRTIVDPPDRELFNRAFAAGKRFAPVPKLTVCKFPSVWQKNSYRDRRSDQQAAYSRRMQADPHFLTAELMAIVATYALERQLSLALPTAPDEMPPGWSVRQYRRMRGLEPERGASASPDTATDEEATPRDWSALDIDPARYRQSLVHALREREEQLAEAERYTQSLKEDLAQKERARREVERALTALHRHAAAREREFAKATPYTQSLERLLAGAHDELRRTEEYARSLEDALTVRGETLRDAEGYAAALSDALAQTAGALDDTQRHAVTLTDALTQATETLHDTQRYAGSLEEALTVSAQTLRDTETYAQSLEDALADRGEALQHMEAYAHALESGLADRGEALQRAHAYARTLESALAARDAALQEMAEYARTADDALARRGEVLLGAQQYAQSLEAELTARDKALGDAAQYVAILEAVRHTAPESARNTESAEEDPRTPH